MSHNLIDPIHPNVAKQKQYQVKTKTEMPDFDIKVWGQIFAYFQSCPIQAKVYKNLSPHFKKIPWKFVYFCYVNNNRNCLQNSWASLYLYSPRSWLSSLSIKLWKLMKRVEMMTCQPKRMPSHTTKLVSDPYLLGSLFPFHVIPRVHI